MYKVLPWYLIATLCGTVACGPQYVASTAQEATCFTRCIGAYPCQTLVDRAAGCMDREDCARLCGLSVYNKPKPQLVGGSLAGTPTGRPWVCFGVTGVLQGAEVRLFPCLLDMPTCLESRAEVADKVGVEAYSTQYLNVTGVGTCGEWPYEAYCFLASDRPWCGADYASCTMLRGFAGVSAQTQCLDAKHPPEGD